MNTITVTQLLDEDGITNLIKVPLSNHDQSVILDEADFNLLVSLGVSPLWRFQLGQVYVSGKGRISVARLITNAGLGEAVHYRDGSTINLRRSNLINSVGRGKGSTRDQLNQPRAVFKRKVQIKIIEIKPSWKQ